MPSYEVTTTGGTYQVDTEEAPSELESFGRGAANNFPLAPQAIAAGESATGLGDEGGYSKNLENWNAKAATAKSANPISYGAGAVTGAVAPLALPGVGEALEAAPIAGNAVYGGLNAISNTDLLKNPSQAAKQAAMGAGIGAGTAGLVKAAMPEAQTLENLSNKRAVASIDMPAGHLVDKTPAERDVLGQFLRDNDLVGKNKEAVLDKARDLSDTFGEKIGEIGKSAEGGGLHVDPSEHYKAVQDLLEKGQSFEGLTNRAAKGLARDYKGGANDILNLPNNPGWNDIQKLKEQYGSLAFDSKGEVKSEGAKDTYFALKDMLKGIADKAQENPNLGQEYKDALAGYSQMHPIVSGLEKAVDAELRGGAPHQGMHIPRIVAGLPGAIRAPVGVAALATGHPLLAGAAALPEIMNPALQSKALGAMAKNLPLGRQGVSQELTDYLEQKYGTKK